MLGNTQTVNNRSFVSFCIHTGSFSQIICINVTDLCHTLRCVFLYDLFNLIVSFGALCNKFIILQTFLNDHMHHTVGKRHIGTGFQFQMNIGSLCQTDVSRIHYDQLTASFYSLTDLHTNYGMCFFRIGTNQHDHIRLLCNILDGIGHGTGTKGHGQTGNRGRMTYAGTVIGIVGTEAGTYHLLYHIDIFVW